MEGPRHQHLHQEWQEPLEERGAKDVDGAAGADDFDDSGGVNDVVRMHEGGRSALRQLWPWPKTAFLVIIMARYKGWSRGRHTDIKMTAANDCQRLCVRKAERYSEMTGRRKRSIAIVGAALVTEGLCLGSRE